ncbi:MAG: NINE protein [Candidatus Delongbacteria bacterium]|nr:NINE protein [Candidatus Delongbacteria bacterium]MBN2834238.1 NINE protein [Candidatus Delongbacteria bacterium]
MRNKYVAALLAFFLGSFGVHKFYLGRYFQGLIYLLFFWSGLATFISIIEGIIYLSMVESDFDRKYNYDNPGFYYAFQNARREFDPFLHNFDYKEKLNKMKEKFRNHTEAKDVTYCSNCGTQNSKSSTFCSNCGSMINI